MNSYLRNSDWTRVIVDAACGVACYEGSIIDGQFVGTHQGACKDEDDARKWLDGETPASFVRVYPSWTQGEA